MPTWASTTTLANISGTLAVSNGGTGAATLTGLIKGNGTSAFTAASAGTDYVAPATTITAGSGLSGGGDLSTNRTLSLDLTSANTWTGLQKFSNASTSLFLILDTLYVGRTATTTIRGDGAASSLPFASSTALTVSGTGYFGTASTTNLIVSGAPGGLLKTSANGVVSVATAGSDYAAASSIFGNSWDVSGNFLSPTTTTYITNIQQASSTLFSALQAKFGATASTTIDTAGNLARRRNTRRYRQDNTREGNHHEHLFDLRVLHIGLLWQPIHRIALRFPESNGRCHLHRAR